MYRTSDIAKINNIHPNTVLFYERLGLISPVPRESNGYRVFNERHLVQVMVLRCIYLDEWPGKPIRKASLKIIEALKSWDLAAAHECAKAYKKTIASEYEKAQQAIHILEKWTAETKPEAGNTYTRREAASMLGVTSEALRNWERNDLVRIPRKGPHQTRVYGPKEMERLQVIYLLRQARFSMSVIHRCLLKLDAGLRQEALEALKHPHEEETVWTGDRWLAVLERTGNMASRIEDILNQAEKDNPTLIHHPRP